jgi:hypothetical protein
MDSPIRRPHVKRASAFLEAVERRDTNRHGGIGEFILFWHHDPSQACVYEARPEGMTGVAVRYEPGAIEINRAIMVVWSRGIRDPDGRVGHHEAGIRYL